MVFFVYSTECELAGGTRESAREFRRSLAACEGALEFGNGDELFGAEAAGVGRRGARRGGRRVAPAGGDALGSGAACDDSRRRARPMSARARAATPSTPSASSRDAPEHAHAQARAHARAPAPAQPSLARAAPSKTPRASSARPSSARPSSARPWSRPAPLPLSSVLGGAAGEELLEAASPARRAASPSKGSRGGSAVGVDGGAPRRSPVRRPRSAGAARARSPSPSAGASRKRSPSPSTSGRTLAHPAATSFFELSISERRLGKEALNTILERGKTHNRLLAKASASVDTREPRTREIVRWHAMQKAHDPMPELDLPLDVKHHSSWLQLNQLKWQMEWHQRLISKTRANVDMELPRHVKIYQRRKRQLLNKLLGGVPLEKRPAEMLGPPKPDIVV
jgi:hypothetical protein